MKLYHIHRANDFDNFFEENNSFIVDNIANSMRRSTLNRSLSYVERSEKKGDITVDYRGRITELLNIEKISKLSDDKKKDLVRFVHDIIANMEIDFRELILEEVRRSNFNDRPSRYSCMWLTDLESLPYWEKEIVSDNGIKIFEVDVDGNLFVSTDTLLPYGYKKKEHIYEEAFKYWNPKEEDLKDAKDKEYLFEGRVKVLKRIK